MLNIVTLMKKKSIKTVTVRQYRSRCIQLIYESTQAMLKQLHPGKQNEKNYFWSVVGIAHLPVIK